MHQYKHGQICTCVILLDVVLLFVSVYIMWTSVLTSEYLFDKESTIHWHWRAPATYSCEQLLQVTEEINFLRR